MSESSDRPPGLPVAPQSSKVRLPRFPVASAEEMMMTGPPSRLLLRRGRMNLRDISARELYQSRGPSVRRVRVDEHDATRRLCLGQGPLQIVDLVARHFAPVRVRQVAVRGEYGHLAEHRLDPDPSICMFGSA